MRTWPRIFLLTALTAGLSFLLHWNMEWMVHTFGLGGEITEGWVASLIAAVVVFNVQVLAQRRRLAYQRRIEAITALNHHVRNALQIVLGYADPSAADHVAKAVARIDWVLREVEPELRSEPDASRPNLRRQLAALKLLHGNPG